MSPPDDSGIRKSYAAYGRHFTTKAAVPVLLWATLSRGREVESTQINQLVDARSETKGIGFRDVWLEHDGERRWPRTDPTTGQARSKYSRKWYILRMKWVRGEDGWRGEWIASRYDRSAEYGGSARHPAMVLARALAAGQWNILPEDVLIGVVREVTLQSANTVSCERLADH